MAPRFVARRRVRHLSSRSFRVALQVDGAVVDPDVYSLDTLIEAHPLFVDPNHPSNLIALIRRIADGPVPSLTPDISCWVDAAIADAMVKGARWDRAPPVISHGEMTPEAGWVTPRSPPPSNSPLATSTGVSVHTTNDAVRTFRSSSATGVALRRRVHCDR